MSVRRAILGALHRPKRATNANARAHSVVRAFRRFLEQHPIVYVDVGARDAAPAELSDLRAFVDLIAVEADTEEAERLDDHLRDGGFRSVTVLGHAAARTNGTASLHVTADRGGSSLLPPDEGVYARYGYEAAVHVERDTPVATRTLASILDEAGVGQVDAIKLDTQGTELEIVRSLDQARLDSLLLIESEVEFVRLYRGQPLFRDLDEFACRHGFELFHLNRVFWSYGSGAWRPYGRGQLVHGDAHYVRHATRNLSPATVAKLIVLGSVYGYSDYARFVFSQNEDAVRSLGAPFDQEFIDHFAKNRQSPAEKIATSMHLVLDNLLYLYLKRRRWNGLASDSDRHYPTR